MKRKKIAARICALILTAGLIAADAVPALAAAAKEQAAGNVIETGQESGSETSVVTGEKSETSVITGEEPGPFGGAENEEEPGLPAETENEEEPELPAETENEEEAELPAGTENEEEIRQESDSEAPAVAEEPEPEPVSDTEDIPEMSDTGKATEIESVFAAEENQETAPVSQEKDDGLIYVNNVLYNGYYMDAGEKMYTVRNGAGELKTGVLKAGTGYYSEKAGKTLTLSEQKLYVKGEAYTGYYMGTGNKMYHAAKGKLTLKSGVVKAGTVYYSYQTKTMRKLAIRRLYVKGKAYTGYYMGTGNKMYRAAKGKLTLKSGVVKAETRYYSYQAKTIRKLTAQRLYVKGKAFTGYYMGTGNKMYRVTNGKLTLKSGVVKAGIRYYSYKTGKMRTLSAQTLYVKGKVYTGYYLGIGNKMYSVTNGTCIPANTTLDAGTAYYSYSAGRILTLPAMMVYVNGKAMEGMSVESLITLQRAQEIVNSITNAAMTKEEKLRVCFDFVKSYREINPRIPHYRGMDWPIVYANDMFVNGAGNCCSYASALAYMAKAIGYEEVYCCNSGGHGWAEIDGLVYDPEWSMHHHIYNYYALSYDTPTDQDYKGAIASGQAWMRIKI